MRLLPAGITDDDVETAKSADGFIDQALAECLIAEIARNRQRFPAGVLNQRDDRARRVLPSESS